MKHLKKLALGVLAALTLAACDEGSVDEWIAQNRGSPKFSNRIVAANSVSPRAVRELPKLFPKAQPHELADQTRRTRRSQGQQRDRKTEHWVFLLENLAVRQ